MGEMKIFLYVLWGFSVLANGWHGYSGFLAFFFFIVGLQRDTRDNWWPWNVVGFIVHIFACSMPFWLVKILVTIRQKFFKLPPPLHAFLVGQSPSARSEHGCGSASVNIVYPTVAVAMVTGLWSLAEIIRVLVHMDWTLEQGWAVDGEPGSGATKNVMVCGWFSVVVRCLDVVFCCAVVFVCVRLWKAAVRRVQKFREIQREDFEKNLPQEIPGYGAVSEHKIIIT